MDSKNFKIEILNSTHDKLRVDYYFLNKKHLEVKII